MPKALPNINKSKHVGDFISQIHDLVLELGPKQITVVIQTTNVFKAYQFGHRNAKNYMLDITAIAGLYAQNADYEFLPPPETGH